MPITNQIFEHFRSEEKKIEEAILLLKKKGYAIYRKEIKETEVV